MLTPLGRYLRDIFTFSSQDAVYRSVCTYIHTYEFYVILVCKVSPVLRYDTVRTSNPNFDRFC